MKENKISSDKLPPGLKEGNDFLLYKNEPDKDGKDKKVPYQVNGVRADPGNEAHLTDIKLHMKLTKKVDMTESASRLRELSRQQVAI